MRTLMNVMLVALMLFAGCSATAAEPAEPSHQTLAALRSETRQMLNAGDYDGLIKVLTRVRSTGTPALRQFAQEFMGVTRERKGQLTFARREYERYLSEFADSPGADRVRLRLNALLASGIGASASATATAESGDAVSAAQGTPARSSPSVARSTAPVRGGIGIDYRDGRRTNDRGLSTTTLSSLNTDVDLELSGDRRDGSLDARVSVSHQEDLRDQGGDGLNRIRYLYADYRSDRKRNAGTRLRVGRQRTRRIVTLGRFDGFDLRYAFDAGPAVSLLAGSPVGSSRNGLFEGERRFVGAAVDSINLTDALSLGAHVLVQETDGLTDRQAVGGQLRYSADGLLAQALLDYDTHFRAINAAMLGINRVAGATHMNLTWTMRKSPLLSTTNALIGQGTGSIADLRKRLLTDEELEELAVDRSLDSESLVASINHRFSDRYALSTSLSRLTLDEGVASGGLAASPRYQELGVDARLTVNRLFSDRHDIVLGVRHVTREDQDQTSLFLDSNYRTRGQWRIRPGVRMDVRDNIDGSSQVHISPQLRVQREWPHHTILLETGYHTYRTSLPGLRDLDEQMLVTYASYRYRF